MMKLLSSLILIIICSTVGYAQTLENLSLVPMPSTIESLGKRDFTLNSNHIIGISEQSLLPAAEYLNTILSKATGYNLSIEQGRGDIELVLNTDAQTGGGAYTLSVDRGQVAIKGNDYGAIISGISTLRQLFPHQIEQFDSKVSMTLPTIKITDNPEYQWRGLMLDVSRHFFTVNEVKGLLDLMAMYKLNKFHWHLTDDQGWRIEIKQYPLLTEKGGWRKFNNHDRECIRLAKLGDLDRAIPEDRLKIEGIDTLYGGFYTQDQIRDVVQYAKVRGIDVMPEIDLPGHFLAAIENYEGVACFETVGWGDYFSSPICPGKDYALEFSKNIYDEIFELFPYEYVHLGADEVEKTNWKKCPDCQKRMNANGLKTEEELQSWFVKDMESYFNENGKKLMGWDEITEGGVSSTAVIMWWRKGHGKEVGRAAKAGNDVIVCTSNSFYFDREQSPSRLKGFYEDEYLPDGISRDDKDMVIGVQGNIWTEWISSWDYMIYKSFPRFIVLAEKAWSSYDNQSWSSFSPRLQSHLERFNVMGLNYRILDIGGDYPVNSFLDTETVRFYCWDSTVELRYTTDGSMPTVQSTEYTEPIIISQSTDFKIAAFRRDGVRGDVLAVDYNKTGYIPPVEVGNVREGLSVAWHKYKGERCAEIENAPYLGKYEVDDVVIPKGVKGDIGLIYTGYVEVPEDGIYTFKLASDDGSILYIAGNMIVNNDGPHGTITVYGQVSLAKGKHPMSLRYFDSNGGEIMLDVLDRDSKQLSVPVKYYME